MRLAAMLGLSVALAASAHAAPPASALTAGVRQMSTTTASAAVRNHGNGVLRIVVWYPSTAPDKEIDIGPPGSPVFIPGRAAADAPFADSARHPLVLSRTDSAARRCR